MLLLLLADDAALNRRDNYLTRLHEIFEAATKATLVDAAVAAEAAGRTVFRTECQQKQQGCGKVINSKPTRQAHDFHIDALH